MSGLGGRLDGLASDVADRLLVWTEAHAAPSERPWLEAMRGELASLDSGWSRLAWALGGPWMAWTFTWRWQLLHRLRTSTLGASLGIGGASLLVLVACLRGAGLVAAVLAVGGLAVALGLAWAPRWRVALLAPVAALLAVGVAAASGAADQDDSQCTTAHAPESTRPASLVTAQDFLALGDYDYERGDCVGATEDYSRAIALDPTFAAAYNNRAYTAMRQQDYAAALTDLDRAIALRPNYVAALMNRGDIYNYYYAVDRQRAMADYDRVIALGGGRATSVCGHRLLALHDGWSPGVLWDLLTQGIDAGCPSPLSG